MSLTGASMATDFSKVDKLVNKAMSIGLEKLGTDIKKRAIILAPIDTGALRQSAKVEVNTVGDTVTTSFNTRYAKRRHYENNLHPSTKFYLTNALKSITNVANYFPRIF